jgi:phosphatidylinositol alpha-1,6-mannosyltransferase
MNILKTMPNYEEQHQPLYLPTIEILDAATATNQWVLFSFEYPQLGGISRMMVEVARGFKQDGGCLQVLTQEGSQSNPQDTTAENQVSAVRPRREWEALHRLRSLSPNAGVISAIWYPEGLLTWLTGRRPHVVMAHGLELMPSAQALRRIPWRWLLRRVLTSADRVVANSHYTAGLVQSVVPEARVECIPLGVDAERFHPAEDRAAVKESLGLAGKTVLCSVARIAAYKGIDVVLRALALLDEAERSDLVYVVVGKGAELPVLQKLAQELGVASLVRWCGFVTDHDLPRYYQAADLFVLCTRQSEERQSVEGFGLVFLEAQACGTPVVGTRTGGIPDAVREGEGGWLIPQDDVAALTLIIRRLLQNPESFHREGKRARQRVLREATWGHYIHKLQALLTPLKGFHE